jgi:hypothetical protein
MNNGMSGAHLRTSSNANSAAESNRQSDRSRWPQPMRGYDYRRPQHDFVKHAIEYSREHPGVAAFCCFGVGFILGWKLKPW